MRTTQGKSALSRPEELEVSRITMGFYATGKGRKGAMSLKTLISTKREKMTLTTLVTLKRANRKGQYTCKRAKVRRIQKT